MRIPVRLRSTAIIVLGSKKLAHVNLEEEETSEQTAAILTIADAD